MKKITLTLVLLTFGIAINLHGQFTQVEIFNSLDKTTFNVYSIHKISDSKSLNLATLGFFENYRSKENGNFSEVGLQPTLFWDFSKNFSIGPSIYYNSIGGFSQRISAKYASKSERLLIVLIPTFGYSPKKDQILAETFAQFQFNVPINQSISFWVNGQFLNVWDRFKTHLRSFQQFRTGISIKGHQFGMGLDLGHYGPQVISTKSFGLYYRTIL